MRGIIIKIRENGSGLEYGFIESDGVDYYFDNRYLADGALSDYYEDDYVDFEPGLNPYNTSQKIAKNITLTPVSEIDTKSDPSYLVTPIKKHLKGQSEAEYITPEEGHSDKWYDKGRPEKLVLHDFSDDEITILNKMKEVFYHTNAGHFVTRNKGVNYGYSLFGPTKQFVLQLGMEKVEFVMILCDRDDFQRRTVEETFLYLTHYIIPKVRISGHFYVLATKYENIVEQIKSPEIQGALPYSVIPFSYQEMVSTPDDIFEKYVLNRFKEFMFERDFFSYAEPIKDRLFLFGGRDTYAKEIADRCISGEHSGIFGLRKSGKTSVINMIGQELDQRGVFYKSYRCVEFARHQWNQAVYKIVRDIYNLLDLPVPEHDYTETTAIEYFTEDISAVLSNINHHMVLIFDEIEQISIDSTFDDKWQDPIAFHLFWSSIITFCEKNSGILSLIIAGINPSISELDILPTKTEKVSPRNPIYKKLANQSYLKPFVFEQTRRMVNELGKYMGIKFDDDVCFELQKDFGGHPFFTRQMCKLIVEHIRHKGLKTDNLSVFTVTRPLYNAVKNSGEYDIESIRWCQDILRELRQCYLTEYKMLLKIANGDVRTINDVRANVSIIPHLVGYGLVRFDSASKEMEVSIDVVKNYLIKEKEYQKPFNEMSADEIDDEIQDGMTICEPALRKMILGVLTAFLTPPDVCTFIKETSAYSRDNKGIDINSLSMNDLLNPRCVTIHFYVLKDLICGNGITFKDHYQYFKNKLYPYTKAEISSYLSNLYVARNAADHHFEVHNEGTLNNFRSSLKEIKKTLKPLGYID